MPTIDQVKECLDNGGPVSTQLANIRQLFAAEERAAQAKAAEKSEKKAKKKSEE